MISERQLHQKRAFDDEEKFQIITNIVLITHIYYSKYLLIERTTLSTSFQLKKSQKEKEQTMQQNLIIQRVAAIHL